MAKLTLTDITTSYGSAAAINGNNTLIETAFENTLSRDGTTPNTMAADIDMDSNDILNVGSITVESITLNGTDITTLTTAADAAAASEAAASASEDAAAASEAAAAASAALAAIAAQDVPDWKSNWITATAYEVGDLVKDTGNVYICLVDHTSGTFATDLASEYWEIFVPKGDSGAGTGDLVSTNNLGDVDDTAASLVNLGGQPVNATLTTISSQGNVTASEIASDAVTTDKILDANVTTAKIADSNVTTAKIADANVTFAKLAPAAVVTESEGISSNDNDTTIPTSAAVKDYVDANAGGGADGSSEVSLSGTYVDLTGVPSTATEVNVFLIGASTNGTATQLFQAIVSGAAVSSGYTSGSNIASNSINHSRSDIGWLIRNASPSVLLHGMITFKKVPGANKWLANGVFSEPNLNYNWYTGGSVVLAGTLEGIRVTTSNGTDTWDAGTVAISWRD